MKSQVEQEAYSIHPHQETQQGPFKCITIGDPSQQPHYELQNQGHFIHPQEPGPSQAKQPRMGQYPDLLQSEPIAVSRSNSSASFTSTTTSSSLSHSSSQSTSQSSSWGSGPSWQTHPYQNESVMTQPDAIFDVTTSDFDITVLLNSPGMDQTDGAAISPSHNFDLEDIDMKHFQHLLRADVEPQVQVRMIRNSNARIDTVTGSCSNLSQINANGSKSSLCDRLIKLFLGCVGQSDRVNKNSQTAPPLRNGKLAMKPKKYLSQTCFDKSQR